jgi:phage/plasmid-like protein (TIGR03299 family)
MAADFDSGFFVRKPAWHNEGLVLDAPPASWEEARTLAGLDWEPVKEPVFARSIGFGADGQPTEGFAEVEGFSRIARSDTGATLAVPSASFSLISNAEMGEIVEAVIDEPNMSYDTAGSLAGGRKVWALVKLDEPYQVPGDPSLTFPYGAIVNYHDGHGACQVLRTTVRIVCANTFAAAEADGDRHGARYVFRHTSQWRERVEEARAAVAGIRSDAARWREVATELALLPIDERQVEVFLSEFVPMPPKGIISPRVEANVEAARAAYRGLLASPSCDGIRHSAYGLVEAAGEYLDHVRKARNNETVLGRQILKPEPLKTRAVALAREVALAG